MKPVSMRTIVSALGTIFVCLVSITLASGQPTPQRNGQAVGDQKPIMAEDAFKNVQVLRGISVQEFMETMGFFAAATNLSCADCHVEASTGSWAAYADDIPIKQTARKMVVMMNAINQSYFGGKRVVTCYSCHRNARAPRVTPKLAEQYGVPPVDDPDEIPRQAAGEPTPDQILDKYIQAVGGAQKVGALTSFVAKGDYEGYDSPGEKYPIEMEAKAPGQVYQLYHGGTGDVIRVYDGRAAWVAQPEADYPVPLIALGGGDLDGAKVEAALAFPSQIKQLLTNMRTGMPVSGVTSILPNSIVGVTVDDRELKVIEGTTASGNNVKLYFDPMSGLLVRMVRYTNLPTGLIPTQVDYADYRDVAGVKMPFQVTKSWVDGRSVTQLTSIQANVPVDARKFAKPAPPASTKP